MINVVTLHYFLSSLEAAFKYLQHHSFSLAVRSLESQGFSAGFICVSSKQHI